MVVRDFGIGRDLLEITDLMDSVQDTEGITIKPLDERIRIKRFEDSCRVIDGSSTGLVGIRYWIVIDRGEKEYRRPTQRDRYIAVGVGCGEDVQDVEKDTCGRALPERYDTLFEASVVSAELTAICRIMEG